MKNLFLAKSYPQETIIEHTEKLLKEFNNLKSTYPNIDNINWEILRLACVYHDLGKMNTKFQNKISENINKHSTSTNLLSDIEMLDDKLSKIEEIPHGYLSNAFLPTDYLKGNFTDDEIRILYESIYYHHNREKLEGHRIKDLLKVIREDLEQYIKDFSYDKLLCSTIKLNTDFRKIIKKRILIEHNEESNIQEESIRKFIMTKGLLNKIDYAASSGVSVEIKPGNLTELTEKSILPNLINDLQRFMKDNSDNNLIVIASTGIGKTEGALLWIGNNKGFFTLPIRVSINSIYDRIISKIKYGKDKTALLHSDSASEYMKREVGGVIDKGYLDATKQISYPLTICTLDQLIGFIFKYEGFELKLATLSYSKVVIDEIQMYSPDMIAYLILALREIDKMGGKFAIVTATFPPIFEYFMDYVKLTNKKSSVPFLKNQLRHKIKVYKENINTEIIKNNYKGQKVLVIVNTVKKAQEMYEELHKYDELKDCLYMFHSRFIKEDRAIKEEFIFNDGQLKKKFSGIWITTQIVEASLDIDFDILYTELSDISGLLQRMGRVFRNRILNDSRINVNVFVGDRELPSGIRDNTSKYDSIIDIDIFKKSSEAILKYDNLELSESEKMKIVEQVYSVDNLKESEYFKKIKRTIDIFSDIVPYDLKKNEQKLRDITTEVIIPENIYDVNKDKINEVLCRLKNSNSFEERLRLKDELSKKTLTISTSMFETIKSRSGLVETLELNSYEKIYVVRGKYSFAKGYIPCEKESGFSEDQIL